MPGDEPGAGGGVSRDYCVGRQVAGTAQVFQQGGAAFEHAAGDLGDVAIPGLVGLGGLGLERGDSRGLGADARDIAAGPD